MERNHGVKLLTFLIFFLSFYSLTLYYLFVPFYFIFIQFYFYSFYLPSFIRFSVDGKPLVGPVPQMENAFMLAG